MTRSPPLKPEALHTLGCADSMCGRHLTVGPRCQGVAGAAKVVEAPKDSEVGG